MIKVGFIGYGSMGSMLVKGFLSSGRIKPQEIIVSTRTAKKLEPLKAHWSDINIAQDNIETAKKAQHIFLCVKPLEIKEVLSEIKSSLSPHTHIISITGTVAVEDIEKLAGGKVTKIIPSLTSEAKDGITLICHNDLVSQSEALLVETLLSGISKVKYIDEKDMDMAIDLTSCAPGFIAAIFKEFVSSAVRLSSLSPTDAEEMVMRTLYGVSRLLCENNMSFDDIISRVAIKGGITEEGVLILKDGLPKIFDSMFNETFSKRMKLKEMTREAFNATSL